MANASTRLNAYLAANQILAAALQQCTDTALDDSSTGDVRII
jgi:hypothetical protein